MAACGLLVQALSDAELKDISLRALPELVERFHIPLTDEGNPRTIRSFFTGGDTCTSVGGRRMGCQLAFWEIYPVGKPAWTYKDQCSCSRFSDLFTFHKCNIVLVEHGDAVR